MSPVCYPYPPVVGLKEGKITGAIPSYQRRRLWSRNHETNCDTKSWSFNLHQKNDGGLFGERPIVPHVRRRGRQAMERRSYYTTFSSIHLNQRSSLTFQSTNVCFQNPDRKHNPSVPLYSLLILSSLNSIYFHQSPLSIPTPVQPGPIQFEPYSVQPRHKSSKFRIFSLVFCLPPLNSAFFLSRLFPQLE